MGKKYSFVDDRDGKQYVIDRLAENSHLSEWEKKFIKNIKEYFDGGGFLSDKQKQKLSDLWEKY
jgi:hypothetical protein